MAEYGGGGGGGSGGGGVKRAHSESEDDDDGGVPGSKKARDEGDLFRCLSTVFPPEIEEKIFFLLEPDDFFRLSQVSKACKNVIALLRDDIIYLRNTANTVLGNNVDAKVALLYMWRRWPRPRGHGHPVDFLTGWKPTRRKRPIKGVDTAERALIDRLIDELVLDRTFLAGRPIVKRSTQEERDDWHKPGLVQGQRC
jgi:hypothetical protein